MSVADTTHKTLVAALVAAKAEMPNLRKSATNPHFNSKFVPLDEIVEKITPILAKHGLAWATFPTSDEQGRPALRYLLLHEGGETLGDTMALCIGEKMTPQAQGSALSYARRYAAMAVLDLAGNEDDDGNKGSGRTTERTTDRQAHSNGNAPAPLLASARSKVLAAIVAAGQPVPLVLAAVGVSREEELTREHAFAVKDLLSRLATDAAEPSPEPSQEEWAQNVADEFNGQVEQ